MNINGKNGLACITPISQAIKKNKIELRPLPGLPVIRDLVVDMTEFYAQYDKIKPFLQNETEPPAQERLQTPEDRDKLDGLYECILCTGKLNKLLLKFTNSTNTPSISGRQVKMRYVHFGGIHPAIGFAIGVERIIELLNIEKIKQPLKVGFIIAGEQIDKKTYKIECIKKRLIY